MRWVPAYVALGSNLVEPDRQVREAFAHLAKLPGTRLLAHSRLYRTRPMGPQDQPDFINAAAGLLTQLSAESLLAELKGIERAMGRDPAVVRWGPRLIDLDLLAYSTLAVRAAPPSEAACEGHHPGLALPHPGMHERNFVLYPLAEIAPDLCIPGHGRVAELARRVGADGLQPIRPGEA